MVLVENEVQREFEGFLSLSKISELMLKEKRVDKFLLSVIDIIKETEAPDILTMEIFKEHGQGQDFFYVDGIEKGKVEEFYTSLKSMIDWVIEQKEPLLLIRALSEDVLEKYGIESMLVLPLITSNIELGVITLSRFKQPNFNITDLAKCSVISSQVSYFLETFRLRRAQEEKIKELNKLNEIGRLLNSTLEKKEVLSTIIETLQEMINIDLSGLLLEEEDKIRIRVVISRNMSKETLNRVKEEFLKAYFVLKQVTFDPELVEFEVIRSYNFVAEDRIESPSLASFITVPLIIRGEIRGIISIAKEEPDYFEDDNFRVISNFASQAAIALENALIYEHRQQKIEELETIGKISKVLTSTLDIEELLALLLKTIEEMLKVKSCELRLIDKNTGKLKVKAASSMVGKSLIEEVDLKIGEGILGKALLEGKTLVIEDLWAEENLKYKDLVKKENIRSLISVPLILKGKPIGLLTVYSNKKRKYKKGEIRLLETIASQAVKALENARLYTFMQESYLSTINALSAAVDAKDHYTHGHSEQVMEISLAIAREMGLPKKELELIKLAGLLHDIGKIGITDSVLQKNGHLTDEEYEIIKQHPVLGSYIIDKVQLLKEIKPLIYHHHEKWDGSGYPDGLKGEEIPLASRILAVADTFDALTSDRVYRKGCSHEEAIEEIKRCSGTQFDPKVVEAFLKVMKNKSYVIKRNEYNYYIDTELFEVI